MIDYSPFWKTLEISEENWKRADSPIFRISGEEVIVSIRKNRWWSRLTMELIALSGIALLTAIFEGKLFE